MAIERRIALVGLGSIGRRHARLLQERGNVELSVVETDADAFRAAGLREVPHYTTLAEALAREPDIAWICSPTHLHPQHTISALERGCHVFCEKPIAENVKDARLMIAAAARAGRVLNIGFHLHFWEGALRMKAAIESGTLGKALHLHARVGTYLTLVNSGSRYQARHAGSLFLDYSHQPDMFYWLLGSAPQRVFVSAIEAGDLELSSSPNIADISLIYDGPVRASIHLNYVQEPERHEYEIVGDRAWLHADLVDGTVSLGRRGSGQVERSRFAQDKDAMVRAEHEAFFEAVDGLKPPSSSGEAALIAAAVCEAAMRSWRSGAPAEIAYGE